MKRTAKLFLTACLMAGTFLIGGCEEGSYSFEHSSSVEVSTESGPKYSSSYMETKSANGLFMYKLNDVNLLDGRTEFRLSLTNNGKRDTTLTAITITFSAKDEKGKVIREGDCAFDKLQIALPQGKEVYETFIIEDASWKAYDDAFNIHCEFTDVAVNPPVE